MYRIDLYEPVLIGWLACSWLVIFVAELGATSLYDGYSWVRQRRNRP